MAGWFQLSLTVQAEAADILSAQVFDLGCSGVQEEAVGDGIRLMAYFEDRLDRDREALLHALRTHLDDLGSAAEIQIAEVPDADWATAWRVHFKPVFPTPRMVVCPPWDVQPAPDGGFSMVIDPQMGFGTGHHETTRLALAGLERCVKVGSRVLDVGTGSGILSIAAVKLGAAFVAAVDTDKPAIENARDNLVQNGVADGVDVRLGSVDAIQGVFDVVVANIISSILAPMLPDLVARMADAGQMVLGGILGRERDAFLSAVADAGLAVRDEMADGEWLCVIAGKGALEREHVGTLAR